MAGTAARVTNRRRSFVARGHHGRVLRCATGPYPLHLWARIHPVRSDVRRHRPDRRSGRGVGRAWAVRLFSRGRRVAGFDRHGQRRYAGVRLGAPDGDDHVVCLFDGVCSKRSASTWIKGARTVGLYSAPRCGRRRSSDRRKTRGRSFCALHLWLRRGPGHEPGVRAVRPGVFRLHKAVGDVRRRRFHGLCRCGRHRCPCGQDLANQRHQLRLVHPRHGRSHSARARDARMLSGVLHLVDLGKKRQPADGAGHRRYRTRRFSSDERGRHCDRLESESRGDVRLVSRRSHRPETPRSHSSTGESRGQCRKTRRIPQRRSTRKPRWALRGCLAAPRRQTDRYRRLRQRALAWRRLHHQLLHP